jgi:hypothetical protein
VPLSLETAPALPPAIIILYLLYICLLKVSLFDRSKLKQVDSSLLPHCQTHSDFRNRRQKKNSSN